jgi:ParB family chromosome partitioning protein
MKRQALGKGLSSLIPEPAIDGAQPGLVMLDIDRIRPNAFQPRTDFSGLEGLVTSIKENGIVQPVIVRREPDGFQLVAGERRWRAAQMAGINRIPAVIRTIADDRLLEVALIENIQRKELNPIEEANAYHTLIHDMNLSQAEIAKRVGRERSSVANSLRILKLPDKVKALIQDGLVTVGHAKVLMALSDPGTKIRVAEEVVAKLLSVRETEARVAEILKKEGRASGREATRAAAAGQSSADPNVAAAAEKLTRALQTKVRIVKKGGRGRIEIEFYADAELDRLYGILLKADRGG